MLNNDQILSESRSRRNFNRLRNTFASRNILGTVYAVKITFGQSPSVVREVRERGVSSAGHLESKE